jgi:hypothetical protein
LQTSTFAVKYVSLNKKFNDKFLGGAYKHNPMDSQTRGKLQTLKLEVKMLIKNNN